jgi:hypothetical protein
MSEHHSDDEHHEEHDSFKVGEKKTIDQYAQLGTWLYTSESIQSLLTIM